MEAALRVDRQPSARPLKRVPIERELDSIGPWMQNGTAKRGRAVKSAERTLALFELFSLKQYPMQVGEISRELGIPQPSASMLLRNLSHLGYLQHNRAARTYVPTIRIMLLSEWINRSFNEERSIERRLAEVVQRTGETVALSMQNGVYSQYIWVQMPERPDLAVKSGLLRPITCTASGRALLSLKPNSEIETLIRHCNAEVLEDRHRVRPAELLADIELVRTQGYAETAGHMTPDRAVLAVTVVGSVDQTPMAIGVGGVIRNIAAKRQLILDVLMEFRDSSH
jgi:DNA-binding IclR family transcriptional regulator